MPELLLSHLEYNEIGQLIAKHLNLTNYTGLLPQTIVESAVLTTSKADVATVSVSLNPGFSITGSATNTYSASIGSSVGTFAQTNEYRYTIRGQLRTINNPSLIADKGITQSDSAALFGEQVNYGENTGLVGTPEYNGNISSISWRNKIEVSGQPGVVGGTQGYTFGYDGVDRQTSSSYYNLVGAGATWTQSSVDAFSENVPKYDEMGNIDSLVRKDKSGNVINRLSYKYASNGNKLAGVTDMGTEGFTSSYTYDGNGNMTSDTKKGITLTYNYLDLVDTVKQGTSRLVYTYDATGKKCYKQLITAGVVTSQRHYVENVEATATSSLAKDGQIEFVATPEGRLVNTGGGNYQQEYFVTDHLGNIRVAFRVNTNGTLNLTQVQNYYSFGKDMGDATMNYTASPQNQYKYSSKELQQELSLMNYDFGARHYDPRIGRWTGVDLLAETYENVSPYNYVANSPINNIDANGMDFSQGIPCPKWGEPGGGLFSAGANVLASFAAGLLGSVGNGPVALDKANAPGQQASFQSRSNITSSLNEDGTTVQEGGGDPGGKKKANASQGGTWPDPVNTKAIAGLDPRLQQPVSYFLDFVHYGMGVDLRITQGFRSIADQNAKYAQGRTTPGSIITNAKGGQSYHQYGLAFDVVIMENGQPNWNKTISPDIASWGKVFGFEWGGSWNSFKDNPHFQMTFGQTWQQLYKQ